VVRQGNGGKPGMAPVAVGQANAGAAAALDAPPPEPPPQLSSVL